MAPILVFTGQHPALEPGDYGLERHQLLRLDCPGQQDPHAHSAMVGKAMLPLLRAVAPGLVIVQGDTSSAFGGAVAAHSAGIALAHVEAGLRSHDLRQPWPEEAFRIAIDGDSDLLFAPTELSAANLRRERVRGTIHVTGNTGIDALLALPVEIPAPAPAHAARLLVTCHRRENWASGVDGLARALDRLANEGVVIDIVLHPNPRLSRRFRKLLGDRRQISFREPCGHAQTIAAMRTATMLLSDSGGIQEEATALGIPLLVLRERTERPEAIACGNVELVGTDPARIVRAVRRRLGDQLRAPAALPFGDGRASERIAAIVRGWLRDGEVADVPAAVFEQQVSQRSAVSR